MTTDNDNFDRLVRIAERTVEGYQVVSGRIDSVLTEMEELRHCIDAINTRPCQGNGKEFSEALGGLVKAHRDREEENNKIVSWCKSIYAEVKTMSSVDQKVSGTLKLVSVVIALLVAIMGFFMTWNNNKNIEKMKTEIIKEVKK